jgi:hypothetical protein
MNDEGRWRVGGRFENLKWIGISLYVLRGQKKKQTDDEGLVAVWGSDLDVLRRSEVSFANFSTGGGVKLRSLSMSEAGRLRRRRRS